MFMNITATPEVQASRGIIGGTLPSAKIGNPANRAAGRSRSIVLWASICICVCLYFLLSDLRGISTDEAQRLLAINGNRLFSSEYAGTPATTRDALKAVAVYTSYRPMFYVVENWVMRIAQSHNLVLLKTFNILVIAACMTVCLQMTKDWFFSSRLFLILTTYFSSLMFMHVLQLREYPLGLFFLATVYFTSEGLMRRRRRSFAVDTLPFGAFGLLIGIATLNSFWIIPASCGSWAALILTSTERRAAAARVAVTVAVLTCIVGISFVALGVDRTVNVGIWDPATYERLPEGLLAGLSFASLGYFAPWSGIEGVAGWVIALTLILFGISVLIKLTLGGCARDLMAGHCALSVAMIISLLAFQIVYFAIRRDALAIWPRYFFQHFWLLHILAAATLGTLIGGWRKAGARGKQVRLIFLTTIVAAGAACLAKGGPLAFRDQPFDDTNLGTGCEWRLLGPLIRDFSRSDPIVFGRLLEAGAITFSANFSNRMYVWDELPVDTKQWPALFLLIDGKGLLTQELIDARNVLIENAGYRQTGPSTVLVSDGDGAGANVGDRKQCGIAVTIARFVRSGS
jgi:hypothetical protein